MTDDEITQLLFVRHEPAPADVALVFGYSDPEGAAIRARHAAQLYRAGHVPWLLFSGGCTHPGEPSEAESMAEVARALGVPNSAILLEPHARTTFENVAHTVTLLGELGILPRLSTLLLVSCPWHMGRVWRLARRSFSPTVRLLCCPHGERCLGHDWHVEEACRRRVEAEAELLAALIRAGLLPAE